jgi:molybdopterin converting factor small subunit
VSITVKFPSMICKSVRVSEAKVDADTPATALHKVTEQYPELRSYFLNSAGEIRDSIAFFVGGWRVYTDHKIDDGAVLDVVFQIQGGSG